MAVRSRHWRGEDVSLVPPQQVSDQLHTALVGGTRNRVPCVSEGEENDISICFWTHSRQGNAVSVRILSTNIESTHLLGAILSRILHSCHRNMKAPAVIKRCSSSKIVISGMKNCVQYPRAGSSTKLDRSPSCVLESICKAGHLHGALSIRLSNGSRSTSSTINCLCIQQVKWGRGEKKGSRLARISIFCNRTFP